MQGFLKVCFVFLFYCIYYTIGYRLANNPSSLLCSSNSNHHNRALVRNTNKFFANKVDGVSIEGELTPILNNVLVRVKEAPSSTTGGLYIPDNAKERPTEGLVVAVGTGRIHPDTGKQLEMSVKVGQHVIYGKYDGTELKYNDQNHQLIKDDDVLLAYDGTVANLENVQCVKDQVLIQLLPKEQKNAAGIIVSTPGKQEKRPDAGIVKKVGPGKQAANGEYMKVDVKPGDHVKFREYAGSLVKIEGKDHMVVRAHDVLAKW